MALLFPQAEAEFSKVAGAIKSASNVAVLAHIKPDADAIGSACALVRGLRQIGIEASAYIGQPFPHANNLRSIPGVDEVVYGEALPADGLIVTVDCASVDRTGCYQSELMAQQERVIVLDHHRSNDGFGARNLIIDSESTTTIIRELFTYLGVELDAELAYCLYSGLVTDTGNFRWGSPRMHTLAGELLEFGLNPRNISLQLSDEMTADDLRLMGSALASLESRQVDDLTVSFMCIDEAAMQAMSQTAVEAVIDYARVLVGSDVGVVLKQFHSERWGISLRSTKVDVSVVANALGGGGHRPAAGYSAQGTKEQVQDQLLAALHDAYVAE